MRSAILDRYLCALARLKRASYSRARLAVDLRLVCSLPYRAVGDSPEDGDQPSTACTRCLAPSSTSGTARGGRVRLVIDAAGAGQTASASSHLEAALGRQVCQFSAPSEPEPRSVARPARGSVGVGSGRLSWRIRGSGSHGELIEAVAARLPRDRPAPGILRRTSPALWSPE